MKAIEINGKISIIKDLPKNLISDDKVILNARKLSDKDLQKLGYYDFVKPAIDKDTQSLGNVYFDAENSVFTREIIEKDFDALVELEDGTEVPAYDLDAKKQELISKLKAMCGSMLSDTDWQVIREAERGIAMDAEVAEKRAKIIAKCDAKEAEVNALTKYVDALKYNTSFYTEQLDENGDVVVDEMGMPILAI